MRSHPVPARRWAAMVAAAVVFSAGSDTHAQADRATDASEYRREGTAHLAAGNHSEALAAYRAAVAQDPDDAMSLDAIGVILGDREDMEGAIAAFHEAIRRDSTFAPAHLHLGLALERTGHLEAAITAYKQALRLDPGRLEARYGLSSVCARVGDLDGAISLLRQVVAAMPDLADARYNLGVNLWNRYKSAQGARNAADLDAAVDELTTAARLAPGMAHVHAALGRLLAERQNLDRAVAHLGKARELEPTRADHAFDLALALRLAGDLEGAAAQLRAALSAEPRHAPARRALGLVRRTKDDLRGAAAEFELAAAAAPHDAVAHQLLGSTRLKLGDETGGVTALRRAIELAPDLVEARVALAQALARAGLSDEAGQQQEAIRRINAARADAGRAMILLQTASDHLRAGDRAAAVSRLREAVALAPHSPEAHYQLASALRLMSGDAAEIEQLLDRVLQLEPRHAGAHLERGLLYSRARRDVAFAALRRAVELAPGLVPAHRALADLAAARQDLPTLTASLEAIVVWQPEDAAAHLALGHALARQQAWAEAAVTLRHAVTLAPESPQGYYALAETLEAAGSSEEAARAFAIARRLDARGGRPR